MQNVRCLGRKKLHRETEAASDWLAVAVVKSQVVIGRRPGRSTLSVGVVVLPRGFDTTARPARTSGPRALMADRRTFFQQEKTFTHIVRNYLPSIPHMHLGALCVFTTRAESI